MLKKLSLALAILTITSQAHSRGIDLKLAEEMVEITYLTESSTFGYGGADIGFGAFLNENDDYQFNLEAMVTGSPAGNNKSLQLGVGGKIMYTSFDRLDLWARFIMPPASPHSVGQIPS